MGEDFQIMEIYDVELIRHNEMSKPQWWICGLCYETKHTSDSQDTNAYKIFALLIENRIDILLSMKKPNLMLCTHNVGEDRSLIFI